MCNIWTSRSFWSFIAALFIVAFGLNWVWEMIQMRAYVEMAEHSWRETAFRCAEATLGDVALTFSICGVGALAAGQLQWPMKDTWNVYGTAALLGGILGAAIEWRALAIGRWSYNDQMPVVPLLRVGLWPLLQLGLLVPTAFWIAVRFTVNRKQNKAS